MHTFFFQFPPLHSILNTLSYRKGKERKKKNDTLSTNLAKRLSSLLHCGEGRKTEVHDAHMNRSVLAFMPPRDMKLTDRPWSLRRRDAPGKRKNDGRWLTESTEVETHPPIHIYVHVDIPASLAQRDTSYSETIVIKSFLKAGFTAKTKVVFALKTQVVTLKQKRKRQRQTTSQLRQRERQKTA